MDSILSKKLARQALTSIETTARLHKKTVKTMPVSMVDLLLSVYISGFTDALKESEKIVNDTLYAKSNT